MGVQRGSEDTHGPMDNSMRASGLVVSSKDLECGEEPRETRILESGKEAKLMAMECTLGSMETDIRVSSRSASRVVRGYRSLQTETCTEAPTKKASPVVLENTTGPMGATSKVNLSKDSEMGKDYGRGILVPVINTRAPTKPTKKTDMESLLGLQATCTKANTKTINEMGLEKCIGEMGVFIKATGKGESSMEKVKSTCRAKAIRKGISRTTY